MKLYLRLQRYISVLHPVLYICTQQPAACIFVPLQRPAEAELEKFGIFLTLKFALAVRYFGAEFRAQGAQLAGEVQTDGSSFE